MRKTFSVVIPVYNAEKTIRRCVDSLLNQDNGYVEIILINDGSKDASAEICREYARKHDCIVYIEQENSGASAARNTGLDAATGEYITFVDSDDYVLDGYFSALEDLDEEFIVFSFQTRRDEGSQEYVFSKDLLMSQNNTEIVLRVLHDRIAGPWNKRFKRALIEKQHLRFKSDLVIGEDFIFGLEYMLSCSSSRIITDCLYCVDETGMESITRAAKYDFRQFAYIYDYAFTAAQKCEWNQHNKEQLMQCLDYLYCRTAFASTEHRIAANGTANLSVNELLTMFHDQYREGIWPINLIHAIMQICVKFKIVPAFVLLAQMHFIIKKTELGRTKK